MSKSVELTRQGSVALLTIDNPPVNALSHHVRQGLFDGIDAAEASDAEAIVLICRGRTFIAGADISEFSSGMQEPVLRTLESRVEQCSKPVVSAIHGTALGGGLELALCTHFRVAVSSAQFGLPEVKLGILPGAGGTQRLPRVVGVEKALQMVTNGERIAADDALECGLIDEIVDDLEAGAIAFALAVIADKRPLIRIRDRRDKLDNVDPNVFDKTRTSIARKTRGFHAPEATIKAIQAAVEEQDFDAGMNRERELLNELMEGLQSKAQQYYFFAERAANKIPGIDKATPTRNIQSCGVLGAGTMGGGIAMNFANVGIPVTIVERDQETLQRGIDVVRNNYTRSAARGQLTSEQVETRMNLISGTTDRGDLAAVDMVIEAVYEDIELKKSIFAELDTICKADAILASNTSALNIDQIAAVTKQPERVIGTHFFSPANIMKLLEVVRGEASSDTAIATAMALSKRIGKVPVLSGVCHGFIGNRMYFKYADEANRIILEGATPQQVDRVLYDFGFPMGPFSLLDLAGLDIGWKAEESKGETVGELMCESGRRGQKNGKGYYIYDAETRAATPDPEVEQLIAEFAAKLGIEQREVSDEEVLQRCLYPMVNEAAKIIEEGIALRGSDIDVVWVNGYGWPVYLGGPMFWADHVGLSKIAEAIDGYHQTLGGEHWEISPLLRRLADEDGLLHEASAARAN